VIVKEFLLGTPRSVEFVGDGIPLGENGMKMTDESGVSGGVSGKIHSENADEDRGGEGVRRRRKRYHF